MREELEDITQQLKDKRNEAFKEQLRTRARKLTVKLCRINQRLRNEKITKVVDEAIEALDAKSNTP